MGESPFLLNTTVNIHLDASKETYLELVENNEEIQESLYVNKIVVEIPSKEYVENIKMLLQHYLETRSLSCMNGILSLRSWKLN